MAMQPNRSLTGAASRQGGLLGMLGAWLRPQPTGGAATPPASEPSVQALLDRLALSGKPASGKAPALTDPAALQAFQTLTRPGQAASVQPAGWQALAKDWARLSPTSRTQMAAQLKAAGVTVDAGADGRYVSFSANGLRVIAEPATNRLRRTQGDTVLGYENGKLAVAMKVQGDRVEVTSSHGRQTWVAGVGQGYQDGLPVAPRFAPAVPGESPRVPWDNALSNDLDEPDWGNGTRMDQYAPAYDDAVEEMGGTVVEPSDPKARPADLYNCHSFATTGGAGDLFDPFLRESHPHWLNNPMHRLTNGPFAQLQDWQRVHPGDVLVYRTDDGKVTHTGVVREVDAQGNPTLVESKFGILGRYLHEPFDVPVQYGGPAEYFRPEGA